MEEKHNNPSIHSISDTHGVVKPFPEMDLPVKIHIPESVTDYIRRQKLNRIYDILSPSRLS